MLLYMVCYNLMRHVLQASMFSIMDVYVNVITCM